jgi:hypothetical protein
MAGGKKKAARQKQRGKYSRYNDQGRREKNKARRIVGNIAASANPGETAHKVIARYKEVCKHGRAEAVISNITSGLNKRNITPVKPAQPEE